MSIAGGYYLAVEAAHRIGFDTVQLFTKSNNQWRAKPLTDSDVVAFRQALAETGVRNPVAHNSYLINLASPDDGLWARSIDAMVVELERAESLGIGDVVAHPGAHMGSGESAGLARIAAGIDAVHQRTPGLAARIDLESTAGQGTCLGHRFEHLRAILDRVADPERLGVCLDTCHLFAAGYPMATAEGYDAMIAEIDQNVGLDRVRVWHLNDSLKPCGSRVDRHAGIGRGLMGLDPFRLVLADARFAALPMILETPKGTEGDDDLDALNLRVLKALCAPVFGAKAARRRRRTKGDRT
jgi:deoxyribonuclease-4